MENYQSETVYQPQVNFVREGVRIGIINGVIALVLMYGSYFAGLNAFVTTQFVGVFIPYMIVILIIYGLRLRRKNGNYMAFKDGLQFTFMSYIIAGLVIAVGTYILYDIIDKTLTQRSFEAGLQNTRSFLQNLGAKPEDIDKEIDKIGSAPKDTGIKNIVLGYGTGLIWDFIKSLLITLVIRKEKPAY